MDLEHAQRCLQQSKSVFIYSSNYFMQYSDFFLTARSL